ncbi:MAG: transcriptional repressor [Proteobacteria bacterium]|uniref:Transcriptional repressor n=1 Tax=Candidatus Avisuccinivibrio stercorigallinarum TaxID=2840704 RepID=A0A9D9GTL6_9GAMM|nr:transcriptional repressor [Candidatus Avisuccinivibrio stercorigallinarum]
MQDQDPLYEVGSLSEETLRKLEESGLRMTVQRRHIIDILMRSQCTSPKELWYEAKEYVPDLGIATVYRLINRLEQIGVLSKARNLGIRPLVPKLGNLLDARGKKIRSLEGVKLSEVLRKGLTAAGVVGQNNVIQLTLSGDTINVTLVK